MALFFDADWFDARLAERGLDRGALAAAAGLSRDDVHRIICNQREAAPAELTAFAALLGVDMIEISLKAGVSVRRGQTEDSSARLDDLDARLDRIDRWLNELSAREAPAKDYSSPGLDRPAKRA